MRDLLLRLDLPSDFDELCSIADQTQAVGIDDLSTSLRCVAAVQAKMARKGHLSSSTLRSNFGDFDDVS